MTHALAISIIGLVVGLALIAALGLWSAQNVDRSERRKREYLGFGHPDTGTTEAIGSNLNRETPEAMRMVEGKSATTDNTNNPSLGSGRR